MTDWKERFDDEFPNLWSRNRAGGRIENSYVKDFIEQELATQRTTLLQEVRTKVIGEDEFVGKYMGEQGYVEEEFPLFRNQLRKEQLEALSTLEKEKAE